MAATQNTTGNNGNNAQIATETLEKLNKGKTPRSSAKEQSDDKRLLAISDKSCVTALEKALGFGKSALHLEIAVSLSIFAFSPNGADRESKRHAMEIYKEAGFDTNPEGEDYKTVNRRINAAAALYEKQGRDMFVEAMDGAKEGKAIEALKNFLTQEFNFNGINAVLAAAGKPVKQYNTPEYQAKRTEEAAKDTKSQAEGEKATKVEGQPAAEGKPAEQQAQTVTPEDKATAAAVGERMEQPTMTDAEKASMARRSTDTPNAVIIATEHLHLAIPRDISRDELQQLALKIMEFAANMDFDAESKKTQKAQKQQPAHH